MANQPQERPKKIAEFARQLEALHDKVVANDSGVAGNLPQAASDSSVQSVESLFRLIEDVRRGGELETPTLLGDTPFHRSPNSVPPLPGSDDLAGQQLGRFTIERKLGEGGYGFVFLAKDASWTGKSP